MIIDPDTGEIIKAYIFVGVMTYSQYAYVEAFLDMKISVKDMKISVKFWHIEVNTGYSLQ